MAVATLERQTTISNIPNRGQSVSLETLPKGVTQQDRTLDVLRTRIDKLGMQKDKTRETIELEKAEEGEKALADYTDGIISLVTDIAKKPNIYELIRS